MKEHMCVLGGALQNKKGFTLIELLAVIVILAIIALIATPIVLDIINDSRNSSQLRSADFYLDAVEYAISQSMVDNKPVESGTYNIIEDGNVCLQFEGDKCKDILEVEVSGGVPKEGSNITIIGGQIKKINLQYEQSTIMKNQKAELAFFQNEYEIGDEVVFNPGDQDRTWNVIGEDIDTVSLILSESLGSGVAWYAPENNNTYGPITALNYLNELTTNWTNVDSLNNYVYNNNLKGTSFPYGYQKMEVKEGITKITNQDGTIVNEIVGDTKARLITAEEVIEFARKFKENFKEENLRKYIERNLGAFNNLLSSQNLNIVSTVDEAITSVAQIGNFQNYSNYMRTYLTVSIAVIQYDIETTYDISLPDFIIKNLGDFGYWTLSTRSWLATGSWQVDYDNYLYGATPNSSHNLRIRPVITIPKSKLN